MARRRSEQRRGYGSGRDPIGPSGCRRTRHGRRAGEDRRKIGADVLGGRQCGRCSGRDRLCHGRDLSARRKYRRRRLHGHSFGRAPDGRRHRLSRDRARRDDTRHFLGADGKPDIAKSRDSALGIGVPGTVAGLALALEKYGSGKFTLADLLKPAIDLARDGFVLDRRLRRHLAGLASAAVALAGIGKDLFPRRRHVVARRRQAGSDRSGRDARGDRTHRAARIL